MNQRSVKNEGEQQQESIMLQNMAFSQDRLIPKMAGLIRSWEDSKIEYVTIAIKKLEIKQVKKKQLMQGLRRALPRRVRGPYFYTTCYFEL